MVAALDAAARVRLDGAQRRSTARIVARDGVARIGTRIVQQIAIVAHRRALDDIVEDDGVARAAGREGVRLIVRLNNAVEANGVQNAHARKRAKNVLARLGILLWIHVEHLERRLSLVDHEHVVARNPSIRIAFAVQQPIDSVESDDTRHGRRAIGTIVGTRKL